MGRGMRGRTNCGPGRRCLHGRGPGRSVAARSGFRHCAASAGVAACQGGRAGEGTTRTKTASPRSEEAP